MSDALDLLSRLIHLGREGEEAVQREVAASLATMGCAVEHLTYKPSEVRLREEFATAGAMAGEERTAIIGRLAGSGGGRSVILFAHPDGEPQPADHGWPADPFTARLVDGRLHGWGVADDLSGVAAMVSGLASVLADGWRPCGDIIVASTPSKRHARGVAAVLERLLKPDAAIYLHPAESGAGMGEIKACTPGLLEFRIEIRGRAPETREIGHSAFAHQGESAAEAAADVMAALRTLDKARGVRVRHARLENFVGRATNVLVSAVRLGAEGKRNRMPVEGVIEGAVSFPPGEPLGNVESEVRAALGGMPHAISFPAGMAGAEIEADHPLFKTVDAAILAETGRAAFVNPAHTASDIRVPMLQRGIPTVGLGPLGGNLTQNGCVDEWVDAADHERCVRVLARALKAWCG